MSVCSTRVSSHATRLVDDYKDTVKVLLADTA